jgi:hypothetical protein
MTEAEKLALRCEAASGNDALDRSALIELFRAARPRASFANGRDSDSARNRFIRFWEDGACESAAMTLVPEGIGGDKLQIDLRRSFDGTGRCVLLDTLGGQDFGAEAATPALALCAAALRARAQTLTGDHAR